MTTDVIHDGTWMPPPDYWQGAQGPLMLAFWFIAAAAAMTAVVSAVCGRRWVALGHVALVGLVWLLDVHPRSGPFAGSHRTEVALSSLAGAVLGALTLGGMLAVEVLTRARQGSRT